MLLVVESLLVSSLFRIFVGSCMLGKKITSCFLCLTYPCCIIFYPLLTSIINLDAIVIHVPFISRHVFDVYRLEPFPFLVTGSAMSLDLPASVVLLSMDTSQYAVGRLSDLLAWKRERQSLFFCAASLFVF